MGWDGDNCVDTLWKEWSKEHEVVTYTHEWTDLRSIAQVLVVWASSFFRLLHYLTLQLVAN